MVIELFGVVLLGVVVLRDLNENLVLVFFGGLVNVAIGREVVRGAVVEILGRELPCRMSEPLSLIEFDVFSFACMIPSNSWDHAFFAGRGCGCGC